MNILVFNCGSSSLKYRLIRMPEEEEIAGGEAQRVGPTTSEPSRIVLRQEGETQVIQLEMPDQQTALASVMGVLRDRVGLTPDAFGHRVVHGGTRFSGAALLDDESVSDLRELQDLAPLHNPPAMQVIDACRRAHPHLPQIAVFDTAYHATIPEPAYTYALPASLRDPLGIRKYGFHGTSHRFVAAEAAQMLDVPLGNLNAVSLHLGSGGASLCAIVNGASVDNTLGYSPLQGVMMSTRCGDLDPAVVLSLLLRDGRPDLVESALNRASGVLGLSGRSADIRDVLSAAAGADDADTWLTQTADSYLWRLRKYLGAYLVTVGRAHAVIFTDTIGETVPEVRWAVGSGMEAFGLRLDAERNASVNHWPADVAAPDSDVRALVIRTNEELAIAREAQAVLRQAA